MSRLESGSPQWAAEIRTLPPATRNELARCGDTSGLDLVKGRDGVFVNPPTEPLVISRRVVSAGINSCAI